MEAVISIWKPPSSLVTTRWVSVHLQGWAHAPRGMLSPLHALLPSCLPSTSTWQAPWAAGSSLALLWCEGHRNVEGTHVAARALAGSACGVGRPRGRGDLAQALARKPAGSVLLTRPRGHRQSGFMDSRAGRWPVASDGRLKTEEGMACSWSAHLGGAD